MAEERKLPWVIKYRPKRIADVVNQEEAKAKFVEWLRRWPNVQKKAALLYGPPGCGKTSLVEAAANEFGYEVIEMNASDFRRRTDIERIAMRAASATSLFGKGGKKLILLDEVDGISAREDSGGLDAVLRLIKTTNVPVVMTANDPWDPNLRPLREAAEMIEFKRLSKQDVVRVLRRICEQEKVVCEEEALEFIAERSEGDLRAAINDLQALAEGYGRVTASVAKAILRPRDREHNPFETLRNIFGARYAWQAKMALSQSQLDYDQARLWLLENIAYQYTDVEDLARAYDALSRADVYLGRIIKTGDWDLLAYAVDMMTAGVAFAAQNNPKDKYRWTKYSFPQRLTMLAKTKDVRALRDDLARVIAQHLHTSTATVKSEVLPLLHVIFTQNPEYAAKLAVGLGLTERMIEFLAGPMKNEVLRRYRELKKELEAKMAAEAKPAEAKAEGVLAALQAAAKSSTTTTKKKQKKESKAAGTLLSFMKKGSEQS